MVKKTKKKKIPSKLVTKTNNIKNIAKKKIGKKEKASLLTDDTTLDLDDDYIASPRRTCLKDDDEAEGSELDETQVAMFAGLSDVDEVLYEEVEYHEDLENLHPAELAARFAGEAKSQVGGSDEQILKDLRKAVFSVPLLPQEGVSKLFDQIDGCIFPTVYTILDTSMASLEELLQVVIKVAAGNTYGKNIYEKDEDHREEEENRDTDSRGTYRDHELRFLAGSYDIFRLYAYANSGMKTKLDIKVCMAKCNFIRGVYEDILRSFVEKMGDYDIYHWNSLKAKIKGNTEEYHKNIKLITIADSNLRLNKSAFYVGREAKRIYKKYMELRAMIITPYLKSVYSTAKKTAKNSHQMLDNFQNGSIGLMRAVSCYSTRRKACFASVAKCWIKQMMLLSIKEDANFVKLPVSTWQAYTQLEKAKIKLGVSEDNLAAIAKAAKMPLKKAKAVYHTVKIAQVYSLNRTYDNDEKLTLEDIMTNENKLGGEVDPFIEMLREYCSMAGLNEMEIKLLAIRHGMLDLIRLGKVKEDECVRECLIQNLANLGYNYKLV
jgi:DNA-directed RNA polymerase sigma subunit (sigma70/sigma32)